MLERKTAQVGEPMSSPAPTSQRRSARLGNRAVQRLAAGKADASFDAPAEVEREIDSARGGGAPLDRAVRSDMERAFDADFGGVHVHRDERAHRLNRALDARAFTSGSDVFFSRGAYDPGSAGGRELLAHELTHVVQQTGAVQTKLVVNAPGDAYEQEADRIARDLQSPEPDEDDETLST